MTTITLEMSSPDQLIPGRPPPTPLTLDEADPDSAPLIRTLYNRIFGTPSGRGAWSAHQWIDELSQSGIRTWLARIDDTTAGFAELSAEPTGAVGIVVFGLVPEFQSRGYGAAFLTLTTRIAWRLNSPTTRVWLQTSTRDHPHALPNYHSRGYHLITP
jgi:GNAT superfamily N-acetyltransferase